jgi:hypothetical protein
MFFFKKKRSKPKIKFFNTVPGVSTLYPITKSSELNREWISYEKKEYNESVSKCPVARFTNKISTNDMPSELSGFGDILNVVQQHERSEISKPTSIGKCPAINSMMKNGFIIYAPSDFSVFAEDNTDLKTHDDESFPPADKLIHSRKYIEYHGPGHTKWLKDSSKDTTNDVIIKVSTMWNVIADPDIAFLQVKVPYVKETRFSAVTGILDPILSPEINIQLWWHANNGEEITIKAGTPLAMYLPISKKTLEYNAIVDSSSNDDEEMMEEYHYLLNSTFRSDRDPAKKAKKIAKKYWNKFRES